MKQTGHATRLRKDDSINARKALVDYLKKTRLSIKSACAALGLDRRRVFKWMADDIEFSKAIHEVSAQMECDMLTKMLRCAEELHKAALAGQPGLFCKEAGIYQYVLSRRFNWSETTNIDVPEDAEGNKSPVLVALAKLTQIATKDGATKEPDNAETEDKDA